MLLLLTKPSSLSLTLTPSVPVLPYAIRVRCVKATNNRRGLRSLAVPLPDTVDFSSYSVLRALSQGRCAAV